jgi:putative peptidoglycan lipid II flippase
VSDSDRARSTKSAGVVGFFVMCSRVLGLIREQVFAALFGAGYAMDAFVAAFRAPNLLRDLFAEGALSTAFVTTFSKRIASEGDDSAWRLASKVATLTVVFMSAVTLLGILFAPVLMNQVLARGFPPEKAELAILLARIMFPFILMVSLSALVMGMLNAKNVFAPSAMASSFFNLGSILGGSGLGYWFDPSFGWRSLIGLSIGTLIGGFLQLSVQLPALRKIGFRFRPDFVWRDPGVRMVLHLMAPAVIAASAVQVNVMVNGMFASYLGDGPMSWLNYAFRLMQLPIGVFGVAIGTVTLPLVSKYAASNDTDRFRGALGHGMRLAFVLTIPCAVGLVTFAEPIISLLFQRRAFDNVDMIQTAGALKYYAVGLVAYAGIKVLAPAFYAIDKRWAPMVVSFGSIATNLLLNWLLVFPPAWVGWASLGHRGLALSTGFVAMSNFLTLFFLMRHQLRRLEGLRILATIAKLGLGSAALGAICLASQHYVFTDLAGMPLILKAIAVVVTIGFAAGVFFACAYITGVAEVRDVVGMVRRRIGRKA